MSPSPEEPVSETVAGGADAGFVLPEEIGAASDGESADCVPGSDVAGVATGLLCAGSTSGSERSVWGEDLSRAFVDVCRSRLRNRRHVSELCSGAAVPVVTAGLAPRALLVSTSSRAAR